jgi:protein TonB
LNGYTMNDISQSSGADRFGLALLLAVAAHGFLILGVSFEFPRPDSVKHHQRSLEILVVQNPRQSKPAEPADFLAQTSQEGSGTQEERARPRTAELPPPHTPPPATPEPPAAPAPEPPPAPPAKTVIAPQRSDRPAVSAAPPQRRDPSPTSEKHLPSLSQVLASSRREIHRLTAELDRKTELYAKQPRRKHISASTQEYKYAAYLEAWRRKVERIGNLNYPDEAKRRKLYGNLVLSVALQPDGSVEEIRLIRSSGHALLDDAAIRIVRLAAPFSPFPQQIRQETDILEITRTWQFLSNNRLFSQN